MQEKQPLCSVLLLFWVCKYLESTGEGMEESGGRVAQKQPRRGAILGLPSERLKRESEGSALAVEGFLSMQKAQHHTHQVQVAAYN